MANIRLYNKNNTTYLFGQAYSAGDLTASNPSGDTITITRDSDSKVLVKAVPYTSIKDKNGNNWGLNVSEALTALNDYLGGDNPDQIVTKNDKITELTGVTASDFASKPGYTVFVGDTDGSLQTSDALVYSVVNLGGGLTSSSLVLGNTFNTNNNNITSSSGQHIKFFPGTNGNVGIGTNAPSEKLTVRSGTIKIDDGTNPYVFPTADGTNGQVLTTNGSGALSFTSVAVSDTNLGNSNITANDNRTYDSNGNDLVFDPNGGEWTVNDSTGLPNLPEIQVGQGELYLRGTILDIQSGSLVFTNSDIRLGDDLNVQSHSIYTSTNNADIQLTPNGTGSVNLDGTIKFKRFDAGATAPSAFVGGMYANDNDELFFGVTGA